MTESAQKALAILRDPSQFQWYVIPLMAFVFYIYSVEMANKNWTLVFTGLAFWAMDWFNEIWNSLILHFTNYAPVWGAPAKTAFLILAGLNVEIMLMFAISGIVWGKMLLTDKKAKILGVNNRLFISIVGSVFCVIVEYLLNAAGALTWEYPWWGRGAPWLIFLVGYFTFFLVAFWVHDLPTLRKKVTAVAALWGFDIACLVVFIPILKWI